MSRAFSFVLLTALVLPAGTAIADGGVTFRDIVRDGVGLDGYARVRSPEFAIVEQFQQISLERPLTFEDRLLIPELTGGNPGVVLWDYDADGDLDIYATNGPGAPNSLFASQLAESGALTFVEVAADAGLEATDQDSAGACFGDLDNDGDHDLVVLGRADANLLFENLGDGTFAKVEESGIGGGERWSSSCTLGDIDGDGLLDLFVANAVVAVADFWVFVEAFGFNQHNQLFANRGGLVFDDVSAASGVEATAGLSAGFDGSPTVTWAAAMADVDLDGDIDIAIADDQAAFPPEAAGGLNRGLLHVFLNDGQGVFTDQPIDSSALKVGAWMGVDFGDLDCDGRLDLFASNFGSYSTGSLRGQSGVVPTEVVATRWFLGRGDGTFDDPGTGAIVATPFSWGNAVFDYDNDGDLDLLAHGGLDNSFMVTADNPGTLYQNQGCSASFTIDRAAIPDDPSCVDAAGDPLPGCTLHTRRNVHGVAVGDLDRDGFNDVVTVADVTMPSPLPLLPAPDVRGAVLDASAFFVPFFAPVDGGLEWLGQNPSPGDLVVELSSGNENGWAAVTVRGAIGLTRRGEVNRDGIGAVLSFTPDGGPTVASPVTGGSSHLSQHSLERIFGLGTAMAGTVEVLWPGGARNRLYDVASGERLVFPEIPCSFDATWRNKGQYVACVAKALRDLRRAGVLTPRDRARFLDSAKRAFDEHRAASPITFSDIAAGDEAGINYRRERSPSEAFFDAIKELPVVTFADLAGVPVKGRGAPGVALIDYDDDGDLDLYVTNGPGVANSLYSSQWSETGEVSFLDVAAVAGVAAIEQDSTGVCYGDLDNDGDSDLYVLGKAEPNRLFENQGDGTFTDISATSGLGGGIATSVSCAMGDINGDGLLDVVVGNSLDMDSQLGIRIEPFAVNEPNQLFLNRGNNVFVDISEASGLLDLDLPPGAPPGASTITWAVAMVDIDLDGDIDIVHADDQGAVLNSSEGGIDRAFVHIFENPGDGLLRDITFEQEDLNVGSWMGVTFGDFDRNGELDIFGSNFGNHTGVLFNPDATRRNDSRWILQEADGTFVDPLYERPAHTPFGWGTSAVDYDNDGDTDLLMHGGLELGPVVITSPVTLLENDGRAGFRRDSTAFAGSTNHVRRTVHGVAVGDLDNNGFVDVVSVSAFDIPEPLPLAPYPMLGGEFDADAFFVPTFTPIGPGEFTWSGLSFPDGTLSVELSSGGNGNGWAQVEVLGSVGLTPRGRVNRDGIGAVVSCRPKGGGDAVLLPVLGGSSYASQDSLIQTCGLGSAERAVVEILWPGGVRNRLDDVEAGERLVFPEIPCSFEDAPSRRGEYVACVTSELKTLRRAGVLTSKEKTRFLRSALRAFDAR